EMTVLRNLRFKLADFIQEASWQWHVPAAIVTPFSSLAVPQTLWLLALPAISITLVAAQLYFRKGFRKLRPGSNQAKITHLNSHFLVLNSGAGNTSTFTRENVERVAFYKTDEIIVDLI